MALSYAAQPPYGLFMVHSGYDPALVALSIAIAVFASYTALDLGGRVRGAADGMRWAWVALASLAMGGGIWAMHFVGMGLACHPLGLRKLSTKPGMFWPDAIAARMRSRPDMQIPPIRRLAATPGVRAGLRELAKDRVPGGTRVHFRLEGLANREVASGPEAFVVMCVMAGLLRFACGADPRWVALVGRSGCPRPP